MKRLSWALCFFMVFLLINSCGGSDTKGNSENTCSEEFKVACDGEKVVECKDGEWLIVNDCQANNMICIEPETGPAYCKQYECGDGIVSGDEECDDGNLDNYDGCNKECKKEIEMQWTFNSDRMTFSSNYLDIYIMNRSLEPYEVILKEERIKELPYIASIKCIKDDYICIFIKYHYNEGSDIEYIGCASNDSLEEPDCEDYCKPCGETTVNIIDEEE